MFKLSSTIIIAMCCVSTSSAFTVTPALQNKASTVSTQTTIYAEQQVSSRASFLGQLVSVTAGTVTSVMLLGNVEQNQPVYAASYGGVGIAPTAVLDPKEAEYDDDIMSSTVVQTAIGAIRKYRTVVQTMKSTLDADTQANIRPYIIKELDFALLRDNLNIFNSAFEEDTQRGTDRLIRVIIQDITELEVANRQKDNIPRSQRRVDTMKSKLDKLDQAFSDILAFAK